MPSNPKTVNYANIGRRIRDLRKRKGITQAKLAELIDMSTTYISHIETAKKKPSLCTLFLIAEVLGTTVDTLLGRNQPHNLIATNPKYNDFFDDCNQFENQVIQDLIPAIKRVLRNNKHLYK